jgi:DNA-binding IclR family transcriptional regulator
MSRADLARGTGLARTTASSLVAELIEAGQVVETVGRTERARSRAGCCRTGIRPCRRRRASRTWSAG